MALIIIIILLSFTDVILLIGLINSLKKEKEVFNRVLEEPVEISPEPVLYQQQMYDVNRFRERMKLMKQEAETDEDGLYDAKSTITLEQLGMFTGVEGSNE